MRGDRAQERDQVAEEDVVRICPSRIIVGVGRGIDPDGALCLAAEDGLVRLFGGQVLRDA